MKLFRNEEGQTLVFTAAAMAVLLGFTALALDISVMFRAKRRLQIAADAAATAAAMDYYYTVSTTSATTHGKNASSANGVTDGAGGNAVQVACAPTVGPHKAGLCNGYFEAVVTQPNPTSFMGMWGRSSMNVSARAVAASVTTISCFWLMNPTGTDFSLQGAAKINPTGGNACGIYANSTSSNAVKVTGQGNSINVAYVQTQGGITGSGQLLDSNNNKVPTETNSPPQNFPSQYQNLTAPNPASMTCKAPSGPSKNIQGTSYKYLTAADVSGMGAGGLCFSGNVLLDGNGSTLNLPSGLYAFSGNVTIGDNVVGPPTWDPGTGSGPPPQSGVTFDVYSGALSVTSTTNVKLHAPTQGTYNGVLLLAPDSAQPQDAACNKSTWDIQWGSAQGIFDGLIDAPCVNLTLQDQGGSALVSGLIVGQLTLKTGTLQVTNYGAAHPTSPLKSIALVE
jgi:hypothetical protein